MATTTKRPAVKRSRPKPSPTDPRTQAQIEVDERVAAGDWRGFEIEELLTEEGADQILEHRRNLQKAAAMGQRSVVGGLQPFRWKHKVFRILQCEFANGEVTVEVVPPDDEFVADLKGRVEKDRFHTLTYFQGFGFICFPEDYEKYTD